MRSPGTASPCAASTRSTTPEAWAAGRVPGAPFAVALGPGGVVLAKGTVNDARQLASVLDAARARRPGAGTSRRAFLSRAGAATATAAGAGMVGAVVRPGDADAYHFCGHIYTTDGCPHPTGLPRIDRKGLPLRARDGKRVDDLGRLIDGAGRPVDEDGVRSPTSRAARCRPRRARRSARPPARPSGSASRRTAPGTAAATATCASSSTAAPRSRARINGDRALKGYCYDDRKVFCVMYFQSSVPC